MTQPAAPSHLCLRSVPPLPRRAASPPSLPGPASPVGLPQARAFAPAFQPPAASPPPPPRASFRGSGWLKTKIGPACGWRARPPAPGRRRRRRSARIPSWRNGRLAVGSAGVEAGAEAPGTVSCCRGDRRERRFGTRGEPLPWAPSASPVGLGGGEGGGAGPGPGRGRARRSPPKAGWAVPGAGGGGGERSGARRGGRGGGGWEGGGVLARLWREAAGCGTAAGEWGKGGGGGVPAIWGGGGGLWCD